jgi:hypothetical protein
MQIGNAILDRQFVAGIKNVAYPQLLLKKKLSGEPSRVLPQGLSGAVGSLIFGIMIAKKICLVRSRVQMRNDQSK